MARYRTSLIIQRPRDIAFGYISDFSNAPSWDPQTRSARKLTDGPIGPGTRFALTGGSGGLTFELPYEIVVYDPPRHFILEGETRLFEYRDIIDFVEHDSGATRVLYEAVLAFKGVLRLGNPMMSLMFRHIGDSATRGMPGAVERHTPRAPAVR